MANSSFDKIDMSPQEMKNMTKLMKDPKFMDLFADYAKEISDPKNREEMENALRDAEKRGDRVPGFPEGKELLIPTAAFCAKTKNDKTGVKVFINICHSDKIAKPKGTERPDKSGTSWDIPYSLAPAHTDKDKGGASCEVHDFVVSTETHQLALDTYRFKKFLVETAIDAIETQRGVHLSREFTLPRLKYKGPTKDPKMLTIPKRAHQGPPPRSANPAPGRDPNPRTIRQGGTDSPSSKFTITPSGPEKETASSRDVRRSVQCKDRPSSESSSTSQNQENPPSACLLDSHQTKSDELSNPTVAASMRGDVREHENESIEKEIEPKYELIYRNRLDLTQFWEDKASMPATCEDPGDIVFKVHLPTVVALDDIKLGVSKDDVMLLVPGRYQLKIRLKYKVDEERGQAQFDKIAQQLQITLPIQKGRASATK